MDREQKEKQVRRALADILHLTREIRHHQHEQLDQLTMSKLANQAFKFFETLDKRLENIEVALGRLADAKDDRETAVELSAEIKRHAADLKGAIPPGASQP